MSIRALVEFALPAFLGSLQGSLPVSKKILKEKFCLDQDFVVAVEEWCQQTGANHVPVNGIRPSIWNRPLAARAHSSLLSGSRDGVVRARLLAISTRESGAWLEAVPLASVGTLLTDEVKRIAVFLRLGLPAVDVDLWLMLLGDMVSFVESQRTTNFARPIDRVRNPPIFVDYTVSVAGGQMPSLGRHVQPLQQKGGRYVWSVRQLGTHSAPGSLEEIERNDRRLTGRCIPATKYLAGSTTKQCCWRDSDSRGRREALILRTVVIARFVLYYCKT
ncbi:hypothetical protein ACOME3_000184 [Neoechinorhynchus agilis]